MKTFIDNFTGLYPVSKTLRFEARPVPATKEWLESDDCHVLFNDITRDEYYPVLKQLLDDYYRYYIEKALSGFRLDEDLILDAFNFYMEKDFEKLELVLEKLRKNLVKVFDSRKDFLLGSGQLKDLVKLTIKKKKVVFDSYLVNWIDENPKYTEDERKNFFAAIGAFDGFITYLGDYKQTRDNLFTDEKIASSIAYRVIHENMLLYFSNIRIYERIKENYPDLYEQINKFEEFFIPESFAGILSQSQIDRYNYNCIGRPVDDIDYKGVNILINEYRQKMEISSNELPCMAVLYKQILSDRENFLPEDIKNEAKAIEIARKGYDVAFDNLCNLEELFRQNIKNNNHDNIYIKCSAINDFSKIVLGDWKILGETFKNAKYKGDVISLGQLLELNSFPISEFFNDTLKSVIGSLSVEKVNELKSDLDKMLSEIQKYKPFFLFKGTKPLDVPDNGISFANEFKEIYEQLTEFIGVYNRVRNFATKKPYSIDKIKLNFDNPSLLAGWDLNRESTNGSYLFIKDGKYYLGIANNESRDLFTDTRQKNVASHDTNDVYNKVEYKQISGAAKMLSKVFFADKNVELYGHLLTDRIMDIKANKLYITAANDKAALAEWIDFLKAAIALHPEWNNYFNFKFRDSSEYANINEFYSDVDNQAYTLTTIPVSAEYIDELVDSHKMFLFQLYNKDFSEHSKGKENLHTMYWKGIFSKENLEAINDGTMPFIKLNGEAEMFMREASIPRKITHPREVPIATKNPVYKSMDSVYHYDIIKDKRFTERKFFFHCPITLNYRAATKGNFNMKVNEFVAGNPDINIIGIDRGERNLLYYTVINQDGDILAQGSLNHIGHKYTAKGMDFTAITDYRLLLDIKEHERNNARQAWGVIKNIKDLKAGYLSQAVHEICQLMLQYNAIVVLENLDLGFKRSRARVEKQIYQKFEKAMIDKLNYLVFKDRGYEENGSFGKGLQLAAPFESFSRIGKQTGCIYYVSPSYTSQIDPKTGFVNLLGSKLKYESIAKAQDIFKRFDSISYNASNDYFEFVFDYKNFGIEMEKTNWMVCTCGGRRPEYSSEEKKIKNYHVTTELKALFDSQGIEYADGKDILSEIVSVNDKSFLEGVLFHLRLALKMRYIGEAPEDDFFLSPVEFAPGSFFDTREALQNEPQTADANDAYHIALKGLMAIQNIKDGKLAKYKVGGEKAAWFKYMQNQEFRKV